MLYVSFAIAKKKKGGAGSSSFFGSVRLGGVGLIGGSLLLAAKREGVRNSADDHADHENDLSQNAGICADGRIVKEIAAFQHQRAAFQTEIILGEGAERINRLQNGRQVGVPCRQAERADRPHHGKQTEGDPHGKFLLKAFPPEEHEQVAHHRRRVQHDSRKRIGVGVQQAGFYQKDRHRHRGKDQIPRLLQLIGPDDEDKSDRSDDLRVQIDRYAEDFNVDHRLPDLQAYTYGIIGDDLISEAESQGVPFEREGDGRIFKAENGRFRHLNRLARNVAARKRGQVRAVKPLVCGH